MGIKVTTPGAKPNKVDDEPIVDMPAPKIVGLAATKLPLPQDGDKVPTKAVTVPKKASELAALIVQMKKEHGDKTIVRGSEVPDVKRIPTGIFEFDFATGGGFPRGKYSMIFGPEGSCKTNITYKAIANAQRLPGYCNKVVLLDLEHSFDRHWAAQFGIDVDALIVVKPGYGEEAVDIFDGMLHADDVALVVIDSLAVVVSSKEVEQSAEKFDVGTASLLVKRMVNKAIIGLSVEAKRDHDPAIVFINQIRYKIGVMFGNPETTPGGKAKDFLSSLTIRVSGTPKIIKEINPDKPVLRTVSAEIKKAKIGVLRSKFEFDMAMAPHGDLLVGETDSWSLVRNELQAAGVIAKATKGVGWVLEGIQYSTLTQIGDTYNAEADFALHLQQKVIALYSNKKAVFDNMEKDGDQPVPEASSGT